MYGQLDPNVSVEAHGDASDIVQLEPELVDRSGLKAQPILRFLVEQQSLGVDAEKGDALPGTMGRVRLHDGLLRFDGYFETAAAQKYSKPRLFLGVVRARCHGNGVIELLDLRVGKSGHEHATIGLVHQVEREVRVADEACAACATDPTRENRNEVEPNLPDIVECVCRAPAEHIRCIEWPRGHEPYAGAELRAGLPSRPLGKPVVESVLLAAPVIGHHRQPGLAHRGRELDGAASVRPYGHECQTGEAAGYGNTGKDEEEGAHCGR